MLIRTLIFGAVLAAVLLQAACSTTVQGADQEAVKAFFATHKIGKSPDYAVVKNGTDYLATVHGFDDDLSVCEMLIEPYNRDASLSVLPGVYSCVPLNH